jgi:hypothetical protein
VINARRSCAGDPNGGKLHSEGIILEGENEDAQGLTDRLYLVGSLAPFVTADEIRDGSTD